VEAVNDTMELGFMIYSDEERERCREGKTPGPGFKASLMA
jgi:hypothetical protein